MNRLSKPYQDELLKALTDPGEAAAYLSAAIDEGSEELFLLALRNIGEARNLKKREDISLSDLPNMLSCMGLRFSLKTVLDSVPVFGHPKFFVLYTGRTISILL